MNLTVANEGIFTRGYTFTLSGEGYGKKLYPLTGMGTGDGQARDTRVRVCLVDRLIWELLSHSRPADLILAELRFCCMFGSLYALRM